MNYFGFPWSWIFSPQYLLLVFMCGESWWGIVRESWWGIVRESWWGIVRESWWGIVHESFLVKFSLHSSWYPPLLYVFVNLFFQCGLLSFFFVVFSQPDVVNISWITGHIHRSIVHKIDPTSDDVKIPYQLHWVTYVCEMWSEEFIYRAFHWSVKIPLMNRDEDPFVLVQKWKNGLWWHFWWKLFYYICLLFRI